VEDFGKSFDVTCATCGKHLEIAYAGIELCRLRCAFCGAIHAYRFEITPGRAKGSPRVAIFQDHHALMDLRGTNLLQAYHGSDPFSDGQYVEHATFGQGYVMAIMSPPAKMEVLFGDRKRVMLCGQGSAASKAPAPKSPGNPKRASAPPPRKMPRRKLLLQDSADAGSPRAASGPVTCPVCKQTVHPFNLAVAAGGRVIGCMYCR